MKTILLTLSLSVCATLSFAEEWTVIGADFMNLMMMKDGTPMLELVQDINGPNWSKLKRSDRDIGAVKISDKHREYAETLRFYNKPGADKEPLPGAAALRYAVEQTGPSTLRIRYELTPDTSMTLAPTSRDRDPLACLMLNVQAGPEFLPGGASVGLENGQTAVMDAASMKGPDDRVSKVSFDVEDGGHLHFTFDPPLLYQRGNGLHRFTLASDGPVQADTVYAQTITVELPVSANFEPGNRWVDTSNWFEFNGNTNDLTSPSVIGMQNWIEKPSGRHGFMQVKNERFVFEDGTPAKFWGVHLTSRNIPKEEFDRVAEGLTMYGCNLARWMMFATPKGTWAQLLNIQDPKDGMKFEPEQLDLFDYAFSKFKEHGIYVAFSPFWGWNPTEADKERFINWEEAQTLIRGDFPMGKTFYAYTSLMPDVIDLMLQFHVKILEHKNPYTGLRYADDPALAWVEFWNEEDIFGAMRKYEAKLAKAPTYKQLLYDRFAGYLKDKYTTQEMLEKAWGQELKKNETIEAANIHPFPRWFEGNTDSTRTADQLHFFYTVQSNFYSRFTQAVRGTGYKGAINGGCWQAPNWIAHLHNLRSDWETGFIDRHNYSQDDLKRPGAGIICGALQAAIDRPFSYSEWAGSYRVGTGLDVAIIGIYGMGLQGWDASMQFASRYPNIIPFLGQHVSMLADNLKSRGQYPALARAIYRGDIREGDPVGIRRVSLQALEKGDVGFTERFVLSGGSNNKVFEGAVPQESLAVGRVGIEFVDGEVKEIITDRSAPYIDRKNKRVVSNTDQLTWDAGGRGFISIDTPGTQGLVGHGMGREHKLGDLTLKVHSPYVQFYVSAVDRDESIADAKHLLITTLGRTVDQGTVFEEYATHPISAPEPHVGPLIVEPVRAEIELKGRKSARVYALDHDGRRQKDAREIPVKKTQDGVAFELNGAETKTFYYVVDL